MGLFTVDTTYAYIRPRRRLPSKTVPASTATLNAIMPAFTAGLVAEASAEANLEAVLPAMTAGLTADAVAEATLAATLPAMGAQLDSESASEGVLSATLPAFTAALAGTAETGGNLAATLPAMAAGLSAEASASATLQISLPAMGATLTGDVVASGELAATLPAMGAALTGTVETEDNFFALLPAFEAELVGEANLMGTLSGALPAFEMSTFGAVGNEGFLSAEMPAMEAFLTGSVHVDLEGELVIVLPALMMMSGRGIRRMKEIDRQRRVTREFIMASPSYIALTPHQETRTPSGGVLMTVQVARPVQALRKIPMSHTERPNDSTSGISGTGGGVQRKYDMTLLGEWDSTIQAGDTWVEDDGQQYIVDALVPYNGYQVKALVMSYGRQAKTYG